MKSPKCRCSVIRGCPALIWHGPGHQSHTHCEVLGRHDKYRKRAIHRATYGRDEQFAEWFGGVVFSGFFDEPKPLHSTTKVKP